jgi:hypothetical protein
MLTRTDSQKPAVEGAFHPVSSFALTLTPVSLPGNHQTVAGTEAGMSFAPTPNFELYDDNILAPGQNFRYFGGGFRYYLPVLSQKLNNASPNVNGFRFRFALEAGAGVDRITQPVPTQHYGFTAGGRVEYDLTNSGTWTMGADVRYAKFPGLNNNTAIVSLGPAVHF